VQQCLSPVLRALNIALVGEAPHSDRLTRARIFALVLVFANRLRRTIAPERAANYAGELAQHSLEEIGK